MNESCHTYMTTPERCSGGKFVRMLSSPYGKKMSHVSHINESRHTYEWVMSRQTGAREANSWECSPVRTEKYMNESCHTYEWMSHVTHTNESCHTYMMTLQRCAGGKFERMLSSEYGKKITDQWVMSHIRMSHVTHIWRRYRGAQEASSWECLRESMGKKNESCHTYEWVMAYVCMSHITPETCAESNFVRMLSSTYDKKIVMLHIWMSHVTHMTESCLWWWCDVSVCENCVAVGNCWQLVTIARCAVNTLLSDTCSLSTWDSSWLLSHMSVRDDCVAVGNYCAMCREYVTF